MSAPPSAQPNPANVLQRRGVRVRHVSIGSAMKFAGVAALATGAALTLASAILVGGLDAAGALKSVNDFASTVTGSTTTWVTPGVLIGGAAVVMLVGSVFVTAATGLAAAVYNLTVSLTGGVSVTLEASVRDRS